MANESGESLLPQAILRGLSDRTQDKRKASCLQIQVLVKQCAEKRDKERIVSMINQLSQEFTRSRNVNHRKGGVNGLAAIAVGLGGGESTISQYLHFLVPPVLECFEDPESRVCYYAAETLYNISKVARTHVLLYFNHIFDGLCKLFAHVDSDVKNAAAQLDRLMKDIVTQADSFDIESFIPLLQKHIKRTKPYIRQLLVSWVVILDTVPDINMLDYLPEFMDGLFNMLSDGNKEIKQLADNALSEFLREINDAEVVELGPMVPTLVSQCFSNETSNRLTAITWVGEFIALGGAQLLPTYGSNIMRSIMHCISDGERDICVTARKANQSLMALVMKTSDSLELKQLLHTLTVELLSDHVTTRVAALHWIKMLHGKNPNEMNKSIGDLLPALLKTISDPADEVVLINLQVLAHICEDEKQFLRVLNSLVQLFSEDRSLLETRGALVVRKLCTFLEARRIYMALASILEDKPDVEFVSIMVQTLNLILLTAPELTSLRKMLKVSFLPDSEQTVKEQGMQLFNTLFSCWSHNPVATFALCLLAEAYELSAALVLKFAEVDVTVGFLMQVDKLVQLLESPIFTHLRLQLLEQDPRHKPLLKSLYGLLMLLPQSQAYRTLSDRLATVSSMQSHLNALDNIKASSTMPIDMDLLKRFEEIQDKHCSARLKALTSLANRGAEM